MNTPSILKSAVLSTALLMGFTAALAQTTATNQTSPKIFADQKNASHKATRHDYGDKHQHSSKEGEHKQFKHEFALLIPGYGHVPQKIVDDLNLSNEQKKQIADLQDSFKEDRKKLMQRNLNDNPVAKLRAEQLASGKLDPEALLKVQAEERNKKFKMMIHHESKWLAVWKGLNDEQKAKLVTFYREHEGKKVHFMRKNFNHGSMQGTMHAEIPKKD